MAKAGDKKLSVEDNMFLTGEFSKNKVLDAIACCDPSKARDQTALIFILLRNAGS